ncbi:hypothetical protein L6452_28981 [Arctium lappa]|uniref:Uncharacterized protein n=1 Tax=Arctium lappa TaxID=4217 RepID=A0ACB8ZFW9_ARCLA|nr:hypothetical protein L6452_28981 [Arctium lappa]
MKGEDGSRSPTPPSPTLPPPSPTNKKEEPVSAVRDQLNDMRDLFIKLGKVYEDLVYKYNIEENAACDNDVQLKAYKKENIDLLVEISKLNENINKKNQWRSMKSDFFSSVNNSTG